MTPGDGDRRDEELRPARPRRRGLPDLDEVGVHPQGGSERRQKYIICNADEGDPGAFMDRSVLEGDPHSVIEGMVIGAYAIGAEPGLRLRPRRVPAGRRAAGQGAIEQARERGLLGENILGTGFRLRPRDPHGRRRLRLRRGDRADGLDRGQARRAAPEAAVPGAEGPVGQADRAQQRRDLRQRAGDHPQRRATGTPRSAPRRARAPRSSPWPARSTTPASSRCRWAPRSARSSTTSAAASRAARSSRRPRSAARRAAASRGST